MSKQDTPAITTSALSLKAALSEQKDFTAYLLMKGHSELTASVYTADVKRFMDWLNTENLELEHVTNTDLLHYIQLKKKHVSQRTISTILNSLKHYYSYLKITHQALEDPTRQLEIKGVKRKKLYTILSKPELESLYHHYIIPTATSGHSSRINPYLTRKRNKVVLGLMIYQGLNTQELGRLTEEDVKLREGKIHIARSRRSNERTLKLEAHQVLDLMEYSLQIRPQLLANHTSETNLFLLNSQGGDRFYLVVHHLIKQLKKVHPHIESAKQIRTSVLTHWLKHYNLREVQYMAGHRYVSSTEAYLINDLEDLQEDISKFHPIG